MTPLVEEIFQKNFLRVTQKKTGLYGNVHYFSVD